MLATSRVADIVAIVLAAAVERRRAWATVQWRAPDVVWAACDIDPASSPVVVRRQSPRSTACGGTGAAPPGTAGTPSVRRRTVGRRRPAVDGRRRGAGAAGRRTADSDRCGWPPWRPPTSWAEVPPFHSTTSHQQLHYTLFTFHTVAFSLRRVLKNEH